MKKTVLVCQQMLEAVTTDAPRLLRPTEKTLLCYLIRHSYGRGQTSLQASLRQLEDGAETLRLPPIGIQYQNVWRALKGLRQLALVQYVQTGLTDTGQQRGYLMTPVPEAILALAKPDPAVDMTTTPAARRAARNARNRALRAVPAPLFRQPEADDLITKGVVKTTTARDNTYPSSLFSPSLNTISHHRRRSEAEGGSATADEGDRAPLVRGWLVDMSEEFSAREKKEVWIPEERFERGYGGCIFRTGWHPDEPGFLSPTGFRKAAGRYWIYRAYDEPDPTPYVPPSADDSVVVKALRRMLSPKKPRKPRTMPIKPLAEKAPKPPAPRPAASAVKPPARSGAEIVSAVKRAVPLAPKPAAEGTVKAAKQVWDAAWDRHVADLPAAPPKAWWNAKQAGQVKSLQRRLGERYPVFVEWLMRDWFSIRAETFGWMTRCPPPAHPEIGFVAAQLQRLLFDWATQCDATDRANRARRGDRAAQAEALALERKVGLPEAERMLERRVASVSGRNRPGPKADPRSTDLARDAELSEARERFAESLAEAPVVTRPESSIEDLAARLTLDDLEG